MAEEYTTRTHEQNLAIFSDDLGLRSPASIRNHFQTKSATYLSIYRSMRHVRVTQGWVRLFSLRVCVELEPLEPLARGTVYLTKRLTFLISRSVGDSSWSSAARNLSTFRSGLIPHEIKSARKLTDAKGAEGHSCE